MRFVARWFFLFQDVPRRGYLAFLVCGGAFLILAGLALGDRKKENSLDHQIAKWAHEHPVLRQHWCQTVTKLGDGDGLKKGCAVGVALLFLLQKWEYVPALLIALFGQFAVVHRIQLLIARPRPDFPDVTAIPSFGFPSGHCTAAVTFYGFWILFAVTEIRQKRLRQWILGSLASIILTVAISRVFLLAHWFTDVLGGVSFAAAWILLCFWINDRMMKRACERPLVGYAAAVRS